MPILARFEHEMHGRVERGEALTAESMTEYMADLYADAYGEAMVIDRERIGITWARFPHLYQPYYVFQYATGIAAAAELARQVAAEGEPAARRFVDFLKTGDSVDSIEALRTAGVDMLDPAPVQAAFDILAGYIERLDELTQDW
jgi:oligoendopeptidase F